MFRTNAHRAVAAIMTQTIDLNYGRSEMRLACPGPADLLTIDEPRRAVSRTGFAADLDRFLLDWPKGPGSIAVVVADKTRRCGYDRYLPILLEALQNRGIDRSAITLYIAYGTHPVQQEEESRNAYGESFHRYRFVHHDCKDMGLFADLGKTRRGTPIRLRRDILAADRLITFGAVSHHYFAGFGGGRKLVFPGLGEREAIYRNHGLFLDPRRRILATGCRPGVLDENPLAEDLAEVESHRPADLAVHGLLDSHGEVCRLLVGAGDAHFRRACRLHGEACETTGSRYDLVVASCGGHPKDINFIQAHKAVHHAAEFVVDGGTLIVLAQCPDGIGSTTFLPWFSLGGWDAAFDRLLAAYQGNGGTALAMMEKCRRIDIRLVTDLSAELCRTLGATRLSVQEAVAAVAGHHGRLAVIPNASLLVNRHPANETGREVQELHDDSPL